MGIWNDVIDVWLWKLVDKDWEKQHNKGHGETFWKSYSPDRGFDTIQWKSQAWRGDANSCLRRVWATYWVYCKFPSRIGMSWHCQPLPGIRSLLFPDLVNFWSLGGEEKYMHLLCIRRKVKSLYFWVLRLQLFGKNQRWSISLDSSSLDK